MTTEEALAFVREHGVVLASAKGAVPRLTEVIAGQPIKGSWWAHPKSHQIFAILQAVTDSRDILVCRLIDGKVTLVHRRLWSALVRVAERFSPARIAQVREAHTPSGQHVSREVPFPMWVPIEVKEQAKGIGEQEALIALGPWTLLPRGIRVRQVRLGHGSGRQPNRTGGTAARACGRVSARMHVIETGNLTLEPQVAAHAEEMFVVLSDPAIYEYENEPPPSLAWLRERFTKLETRQSPDRQEQWLNWVIRLPTSELIGYVQATVRRNGSAAIAYVLSSRYWSRGLARQAVQAMISALVAQYQVRSLCAVFKRENLRSLRLLERLGFSLAPPEQHARRQVPPDELLMQREIQSP